jgi:hypothetical protein
MALFADKSCSKRGSLGFAVILYTDYADFLDLHGKSLKKSV